MTAALMMKTTLNYQLIFMKLIKSIPRLLKTYNLMSNKWFTHATPTLFNAGTNHSQLSR